MAGQLTLHAPASDDAWALLATDLRNLLYDMGPSSPEQLVFTAGDILDYSEPLAHNVMAWMSINHWAGYDFATHTWAVRGASREGVDKVPCTKKTPECSLCRKPGPQETPVSNEV